MACLARNDPDLAAVMVAWPKLTTNVRKVILEMIEVRLGGLPDEPAQSRQDQIEPGVSIRGKGKGESKRHSGRRR